MARRDSQLNLEPMEVRKGSQAQPARTSSAPDPDVRTNDSALDEHIRDASFLFDKALDDAEMTTADAAFLLKVSESLVNRMRSPNYRECVSLVQLLRCGPVVMWKFQCRLHAKKKFAQLALRDTLQSLSLLAVGLGE